MDGFLRDVRHAGRNLLRSPGFALITVLTLALGIGANTAIFSVVNAVILRPLGYPRPDRLIYISSQFPAMGFDQFWVSPPEFLDFRERVQSFSSVGAFATGQANLTTVDRPRQATTVQASADLFKTLGVAPLLGRTFDESETRPGGPLVVVLSYEVWQSAFGGKPDLVGQQVEINSRQRTVVGVMPPRFDVADQHAELWVPLVLDPANRQNRGSHYLYLVGRLRDGATIASARAELETILANWLPSLLVARPANASGGIHAPDPKNHRIRFDLLQTQVIGSARRAVLVLQGAVVFVLLIACANLANLLLARAESRHKEFAVRAALGAGRMRLLRQFLVEGCVLSLGGAALGLGVAVVGVRALLVAYPDSLPRSADVTLDAGVLVFTFVVGLATGAVFGFAPLLHIAPDATAAALKDGGQRTTAGAGRHRIRRALVTAEVALAVALVIGAGLLLRTVMNLSNVDSGFNRSRLVTFAVSLPAAKYQQQSQVIDFYRRLIDEMSGFPGAQAVAAMDGLPPLRRVNANDTDIEGYKPPPNGPFANVDYYQNVTGRYVETMGIPVVEGRSFLPSDADGSYVALINETMARTFYSGLSPIGRRVRPSAAGMPWFTIVGVLKDVKQGGVDKKTGTELYFDVEQAYKIPNSIPYAMNLVLRTSVAPQAVSASIHRAVEGLDPSLPIVKLQTMDDVFADAIGRPRLLAQLLGIFAGLALLLAAIGAYGVLSYMVTERRREIGIRMALGANRASVLRMVLRQGLSLTAIGVAAGLAVAFAMNRVLSSLLFGVGPSDPLTVGGVVGLIGFVALAACYLPARSATRVDPMRVLREE
ncbi:MAG TPA: ABC transporter permease [Vicinamibacterales bacterium]|nr:ABC transporter permease [Vicinamibacterales bacterium]